MDDTDKPGRAAPKEVAELKAGMDFRKPEYRREVFLRFYEFHLKYAAHPGCIYYIMPFLRKKLGWSEEQALWFAFINGNTQHPGTSLILHNKFPKPEQVEDMVEWFKKFYGMLPFDTDRRYHKKVFDQAALAYSNMVKEGQGDFWRRHAERGFKGMWEAATAIPSFGRLSAFSYLEYVWITLGGKSVFDCEHLFIDDISGSKSHRNGIAKVCGRDDLDWHKTNKKFKGSYSQDMLEWLKFEGQSLLEEARERSAGKPYEKDVSYFTLESTLCTYKGWHRVNRRYPNVYNDMLHDRIKKLESMWGQSEEASLLWEARSSCLPDHLLLEKSPHDPGLCPAKQNHYRLTGQVIMMNQEHDCFHNDFNDKVTQRAEQHND